MQPRAHMSQAELAAIVSNYRRSTPQRRYCLTGSLAKLSHCILTSRPDVHWWLRSSRHGRNLCESFACLLSSTRWTASNSRGVSYSISRVGLLLRGDNILWCRRQSTTRLSWAQQAALREGDSPCPGLQLPTRVRHASGHTWRSWPPCRVPSCRSRSASTSSRWRTTWVSRGWGLHARGCGRAWTPRTWPSGTGSGCGLPPQACHPGWPGPRSTPAAVLHTQMLFWATSVVMTGRMICCVWSFAGSIISECSNARECA